MQIGDRVKVVQSIYTWDGKLQVGETGTIRNYYHGSGKDTMFGIEMDNGYEALDLGGDGDTTWAFQASELEVIQ